MSKTESCVRYTGTQIFWQSKGNDFCRNNPFPWIHLQQCTVIAVGIKYANVPFKTRYMS